jgi:uncharacterized protein (DUF433 family)
MEYNIFIERNPKVLSGKPVIAGTRITVEIILKKMSESATVEDLLKMYPTLSKNQIYAALAYSAAILANEDIHEIA